MRRNGRSFFTAGTAMVLAALALLAAPPVEGQTLPGIWRMYGGDPRHTGRGPAAGPSTPPATKWSLPLGDSLSTNTSPVLGPDGSVYMTTRGHFFAINSNGTVRCSRSLFASSAAPAVKADGTVVYVPDANGLHAVRASDCALLWSSGADTRITYSSPTLGPDGTIYFGTAASGFSNPTQRLIALNPDGSQKWAWNSNTTSCWIENSPALGPNGQVYFNQNCLGVVALDANGNHLWTRAGPGDAWNTVSVGNDGTLYIGDSDYFFYALNPVNGADVWKVGVQNWMYEGSASISPDGSTIYRGDNGGIFYAFRSTGSIKWSFNTGIQGSITGAPAIGTEGTVYFSQSGQPGYLYALRGSDGALLWKKEIGSSDGSSVAIGPDGTVYAAAAPTPGGNATLWALACSPTQCAHPLHHARGDYDGDGKTDVGVYRPSNAIWFIQRSAGGSTILNWGSAPDDVPTVGDFDGDGKADVAVFRPSNGLWFIQSSSTGAATIVNWGSAGDVPVPGDYDGDGRDDVAVYRPNGNLWFIQNSSTGAATIVNWGSAGDLPAPGDFDGDAKTDIAVFRPSTGLWFIRNSSTGATTVVDWGASGDVPKVGDYDGDGRDDVAVYRPSTQLWFIRNSSTGAATIVNWGSSGDLPVVGDYDGDGRDDVAVFRPSTGFFYINRSTAGLLVVNWGASGDIPLGRPPLTV